MTKPKISVIIVYKNEHNLYDCVQSCIQQSFTNTEVICVNNGAGEIAENIVLEQAKNIDKIKLVSIPNGIEDETAKRAGLAVSEGEFVIFIQNNDIVEADFLKQVYTKIQEEKKIDLKDKYLYRRTFIENDREISTLIEDRIKAELTVFSNFIEEQKQKINDEIDKLYKNNDENIKNSTYDIITRFNALEKLFYNENLQNQDKINSLENIINTQIDEKINSILCDISNVNKSIKKKNEEIENIYEKINDVYKNCNNLIEEKNKNIIQVSKQDREDIYSKLKELEKEIIFRYVNLKRIMNIQLEEISSKLNGE